MPVKETGNVVPVKPDHKGEKPDNKRSEDEEKKRFEPISFLFFLFCHCDDLCG